MIHLEMWSCFREYHVGESREKAHLPDLPVRETGKNGEQKFPLLDYFRDTEIPRLEEICQEVNAKIGKRAVI